MIEDWLKGMAVLVLAFTLQMCSTSPAMAEPANPPAVAATLTAPQHLAAALERLREAGYTVTCQPAQVVSLEASDLDEAIGLALERWQAEGIEALKGVELAEDAVLVLGDPNPDDPDAYAFGVVTPSSFAFARCTAVKP